MVSSGFAYPVFFGGGCPGAPARRAASKTRRGSQGRPISFCFFAPRGVLIGDKFICFQGTVLQKRRKSIGRTNRNGRAAWGSFGTTFLGPAPQRHSTMLRFPLQTGHWFPGDTGDGDKNRPTSFCAREMVDVLPERGLLMPTGSPRRLWGCQRRGGAGRVFPIDTTRHTRGRISASGNLSTMNGRPATVFRGSPACLRPVERTLQTGGAETTQLGNLFLRDSKRPGWGSVETRVFRGI